MDEKLIRGSVLIVIDESDKPLSLLANVIEVVKAKYQYIEENNINATVTIDISEEWAKSLGLMPERRVKHPIFPQVEIDTVMVDGKQCFITVSASGYSFDNRIHIAQMFLPVENSN